MKKSFFTALLTMLLPVSVWAQKTLSASKTSDFFGCDVVWTYDEDTKTLTIRPNNGEETGNQTGNTTDIQVLASEESVNTTGTDYSWTYTKNVIEPFTPRSGEFVSSIKKYNKAGKEIGTDVLRQTYSYVDFAPMSSSNISVGFNIPNTLDDTYDIYLVTCPLWLNSDYKNIPQSQWDVRPYRFTVSVFERENDGENVGQFPMNVETLNNPAWEGMDIEDLRTRGVTTNNIYFAPNWVLDGRSPQILRDENGHIIVNDTTYVGQYQFKDACYGEGNYNVIIQITSSVLKKQTTEYSREMLINSIILKPHGNSASLNIQEEVDHVVLEEGITEINYPFAKKGLDEIQTVIIPNSVASIGSGAFMCEKLKDVYCYADPDNLTWDGEGQNDFMANKATRFHVTNTSAWEQKYPSANVTLVGDLEPKHNCKVDGHVWSEWEPVSQPSCTQNGTCIHVCDYCGESETDIIPAIGHIWNENGVCLICGVSEAAVAIESIITVPDTDGAWYTITGVKLEGEPTTPGIYVQDGRKVVVK